ncbi:MAG TPA: hypothetical protein DEP99_01065 [Nitrospiraceae bacterium]|nr:hypothetical protein [Nitrospiraceae bacterium]
MSRRDVLKLAGVGAFIFIIFPFERR